MKELREGLYVDDLMTGGVTVKKTGEKRLWQQNCSRMQHSPSTNGTPNAKVLEGDSGTSVESEDVSYAKQQLEGGEVGGKLLGLPWNRERDTFSISLDVNTCTTKAWGFVQALLSLRATTQANFWPEFAIIPTGNTTKYRQNNATLVSRDSGNARNGFYRSKCTYTLDYDVIPAKGAPYWPSIA